MPYDPSLDFNGEWASLDQPEARIIAGNVGSKDENTAFALAVQGKLPQAQMDSYGITPSGIMLPFTLPGTPTAPTIAPPASSPAASNSSWLWWLGGIAIVLFAIGD